LTIKKVVPYGGAARGGALLFLIKYGIPAGSLTPAHYSALAWVFTSFVSTLFELAFEEWSREVEFTEFLTNAPSYCKEYWAKKRQESLEKSPPEHVSEKAERFDEEAAKEEANWRRYTQYQERLLALEEIHKKQDRSAPEEQARAHAESAERDT